MTNPTREEIEAKLRHTEDDLKMSQQQCRSQAEEITRLKIALSEAKIIAKRVQSIDWEGMRHSDAAEKNGYYCAGHNQAIDHIKSLPEGEE